jgi:hypothetical protein
MPSASRAASRIEPAIERELEARKRRLGEGRAPFASPLLDEVGRRLSAFVGRDSSCGIDGAKAGAAHRWSVQAAFFVRVGRVRRKTPFARAAHRARRVPRYAAELPARERGSTRLARRGANRGSHLRRRRRRALRGARDSARASERGHGSRGGRRSAEWSRHALCPEPPRSPLSGNDYVSAVEMAPYRECRTALDDVTARIEARAAGGAARDLLRDWRTTSLDPEAAPPCRDPSSDAKDQGAPRQGSPHASSRGR